MKRQWFKQPLHRLLHALNVGEASLPEIVTSFYQRIATREPLVQAWQYLIDEEDYLAEYESNKAFYQASPLKGLPFAVKDVIDTAGIPTSMGSAIHVERIPNMDASCVTAMKAAGGILMGKTVTTEFAYFQAGKTNHPHDAERTPGGSSSGSAAAVADYMVPIAFGTQTAASVIRPASFCGCVGYVGSRGEFSLRNILPLAQSLDSLGVISNHVLDTQLIRDVLLQKSLQAAVVAAKPALNFAVLDGQSLGEVSVEMLGALAQCQQTLLGHGHTQVAFPFVAEAVELTALHGQIMAFEVARNLVFEQQHTGLSEHMQGLLHTGLALSYAEYIAALARVEAIKQKLLQWMDEQKIDVILAPAAAGIAPLKTAGTGAPFMSRAWQVLGLPTVTLPLAYHQKMPLGLQLIAQPHADDVLLQQARYVQHLFEAEVAANVY